MTLEPDVKDWTWVLERPCPECGFDATLYSRDQLGQRIRDNVGTWSVVLHDEDASVRPAANVWSRLEYACHVRDVHRVFAGRLHQMLEQDDPAFENWDQDRAAVDGEYALTDPAVVEAELRDAADAVADVYDAVTDDQWARTGRRSNGSEFTVESLGRYHLHDIVHHAYDVSPFARRATVAAYDHDSLEYAESVQDLERPWTKKFSESLPPGARILEIGSGPGFDAILLEADGHSVRRSDVAGSFVQAMRADGFVADHLDPLTDDLSDPENPGQPYDAVFAWASLLHVTRGDLGKVLSRLHDATADGGLLAFSVKEGDGAAWVTHGAVQTPRHYVFWREPALRAVVEAAGWTDVQVTSAPGNAERGDVWLEVTARR